MDSIYESGDKTYSWIAIKKGYNQQYLSDTLDLVIIGADYGFGKRKGLYGSFLVACLDI